MEDDPVLLWRFVRGDLPVEDYEDWLYGDGAERTLGSQLHFDLICVDYRNPHDTGLARRKLAAMLRPALQCACITCRDRQTIPMGSDQGTEFFATVQETRRHGETLWWLSAARCDVCGQDWLIAHEERIYDDHLLRRLTRPQADAIIGQGDWPDDFQSYESVLDAAAASSTVTFLGSRSPALVQTVRDLHEDNPAIGTIRIARLLKIDEEVVADIRRGEVPETVPDDVPLPRARGAFGKAMARLRRMVRSRGG